MTSSEKWHTGNAALDGELTRGWILGRFLDQEQFGVRSTDALEVKWGLHPKGDQRDDWTVGDARTTLLVLISGHWLLDLAVETVKLTRPGDYVVWGPGIDHSWRAVEESVMLTVRWPSI